MIVVLTLGVVLLITGFSLFAQARPQLESAVSQIDEQNRRLVDRLLDSGQMLVIGQNTKEVSRGDFEVFSLGISNEFDLPHEFQVIVTYAGSSAFPDGTNDPHWPVDMALLQRNDLCPNPETCATDWVLTNPSRLTIFPNQREYVQIGIEVPRGISRGQYAFNVDICYNASSAQPNCDFTPQGTIQNRYATRQRIYITV